jgi:phage terminase large subunit
LSASSSIRKPNDGVLQIQTPRAFVPLLGQHRYKGAKGGRGAAKSHFYCEYLIEDMVADHHRVACLREVQSSIKDSVKQLVEDKIRKFGFQIVSTIKGPGQFKITETEIVGPNESLMTFRGLKGTTATSIKSLEGYTRAFVEEAQTISQSSLDILTPTIRSPGSQLLFGWNPLSPFDPVDKFFAENKGDPDFVLIDVSYLDNPWFPEELRRDMERDKRRDIEKYNHIWLGHYRQHSEARVFKNWRVDEAEIPTDARPYYGADWGFATDPSVLVRCWVVGPKQLYIDAEAYKVGCDIDKTPELFDTVDEGDARRWPIKADSARPETISYMRRNGYPHIVSAVKGPGSLEDGIEFLKSYDIVIHPRCKHTIDEFTHYSYKTDKLTNEVLPVLEDKKNHVIDASRYALESVRMALVGETSEQDFTFDPTKVAVLKDWPRVYGLDVNGSLVSAVWAAWDPHGDTVYLYGEYEESKARQEVWSGAIRKRGRYVPGVFDLTARKRSQEQGERIVDSLIDEQLDLYTFEVDAEAAAAEINARIASKQLRVAQNLAGWMAQYRAYRRDPKGAIVQEQDGLMQATGLILTGGLSVSQIDEKVERDVMEEWGDQTRNPVTGY